MLEASADVHIAIIPLIYNMVLETPHQLLWALRIATMGPVLMFLSVIMLPSA